MPQEMSIRLRKDQSAVPSNGFLTSRAGTMPMINVPCRCRKHYLRMPLNFEGEVWCSTYNRRFWMTTKGSPLRRAIRNFLHQQDNLEQPAFCVLLSIVVWLALAVLLYGFSYAVEIILVMAVATSYLLTRVRLCIDWDKANILRTPLENLIVFFIMVAVVSSVYTALHIYLVYVVYPTNELTALKELQKVQHLVQPVSEQLKSSGLSIGISLAFAFATVSLYFAPALQSKLADAGLVAKRITGAIVCLLIIVPLFSIGGYVTAGSMRAYEIKLGLHQDEIRRLYTLALAKTEEAVVRQASKDLFQLTKVDGRELRLTPTCDQYRERSVFRQQNPDDTDCDKLFPLPHGSDKTVKLTDAYVKDFVLDEFRRRRAALDKAASSPAQATERTGTTPGDASIGSLQALLHTIDSAETYPEQNAFEQKIIAEAIKFYAQGGGSVIRSGVGISIDPITDMLIHLADDTLGQQVRSAAAEIIQQWTKGQSISIAHLIATYATRVHSRIVDNINVPKVEAAWEQVPTVLQADGKATSPAIARLKRAFSRFTGKVEAGAKQARAAAAKAESVKQHGKGGHGPKR